MQHQLYGNINAVNVSALRNSMQESKFQKREILNKLGNDWLDHYLHV